MEDRKLIRNLYNKQVANVRTGDSLSTACTIGKRGREMMFTAPIIVFNLISN